MDDPLALAADAAALPPVGAGSRLGAALRRSHDPRTPRIRAIGCKALAALERSAGRADPLAAIGGSAYARADGEIIWIGHGDVAMHPRAVVLEGAAPAIAGCRLLPLGMAPWRPTVLRGVGSAGRASLVRGCEALRRDILRLGVPQGFAVVLVGRVPAFPLDRAGALVRRLSRAFRDDDPAAVDAAALPLLGLGPGLTPSGDDLVGAALLARNAITTSPADATRWSAARARLVDACESRSHPIGAALFRDLASGESFEPLHRLAATLASEAGHDAVLDAARALVAIGHSSGWDMLAGFIVGSMSRASPLLDDLGDARPRNAAAPGNTHRPLP